MVFNPDVNNPAEEVIFFTNRSLIRYDLIVFNNVGLYDRRCYHRLLFFYKIINDLAPKYLNKLSPMLYLIYTIYVGIGRTGYNHVPSNLGVVFFLTVLIPGII